MVKADIKHNYYADLELPTSASVEDIKRQYRSLCRLYHPDKHLGQEDEFVPKFQAIQTAHEVLGDPALKAKYDVDRRKAGLYPTNRPGQQPQATGNPYQATSAYPPPPRRTQPGTYARPPSTVPGAAPTGADRFTNFPKTAPTARKDPVQDRSNMFRAWQNMNNGQPGQPNPAPSRGPSNGQPPTERPVPPPRADTKMPSEDEIRAGMNYRKPPTQFDGSGLDARQSAWASFQQQKTAGVGRGDGSKTPRKQGFDPNAPGSDERKANDSGYAHRNRSEDLGRMPPGAFPPPPPPPGPPPQSPTSPYSPPYSPAPQKPLGRPTKTASTNNSSPQVPFAEGTRTRTPYSTFIGEKTQFRRDSSDGLRRSASTRDASKLNANGNAQGRARSTSPLGQHQKTKGHPQDEAQQQNSVPYSDSEASEDGSDMSDESSGPSNPDNEQEQRPGTAPQPNTTSERPKKVPTPAIRRFNGTANPFNPPAADGAQSDNERPDMQQKGTSNMYAYPDPFQHNPSRSSQFELDGWPAQGFGIGSTSESEPREATRPHSRFFGLGQQSTTKPAAGDGPYAAPLDTSAPTGGTLNKHALDTSNAVAQGYDYLKHQLAKSFGEVPGTFDMDVFRTLVSTASKGDTCGNASLNRIMAHVLELFPTLPLLLHAKSTRANCETRDDSFSYPFARDASPNKSRSEENINMSFSPGAWSGKFTGAPDYFAPSEPTTTRKGSSPSTRQKSGLRSVTTNVPPSNNGGNSETNGVPIAEEQHPDPQSAPGSVRFSKEQWEKTFQDASWTWPPPPPGPPSPKKGARPGRKPSKARDRSATSGTAQQPHIVEDDDVSDFAAHQADTAQAGNDGDAMDIDAAPPAQSEQAAPDQISNQGSFKEPRLYSVPPSAWRQSQQGQVNGHVPTPTVNVDLKADLHGLSHVEPIARSTNGLQGLAAMTSDLPFQSQAASTLPTHPLEPQKLQLPPLPKAPEPPTRLSKQSWHAYAAAFGSYLQAYHAFNASMLQHFTARESKARLQLSSGTAWLEATGDAVGTPHGAGGFGSYLQGVKEDEEVREMWNLGSERHTEAVKGFEKIRERVRKLASAGTLVEH
ncbi:hypothetical protein BAUCODRAFT_20527 [Baudoinia panamericana UAMH 10762]|uniref:J domain-containing protein n=1 Tax=Baudoinia panamericana (strain UAMH 10762) TaxID=717646 RepID=M2NLP8_BAUPA|nr:uncharacterized protein BAUCODRAFT_20527 [Baudoinia panamericana UAMH 10762]EMD00420.1 hypothetical protein BAUCODRAFT_20527 [Baudoinia panamericana UAMH 10762]